MALKKRITKLEDVDEKYRGEYEADATKGGFRLKLEDPEFDEIKTKLDEFRDNNRGQHRELEELRPLKKKLEGVGGDFDPDIYARGKAALDQMGKADLDGLLKAGKYDEYFERRTGTMKQAYETQIGALTKAQKDLESERDAYRQRLEAEVVDKRILEAIEGGGIGNATGIGKIRPAAKPDVLSRGRQLFGMDPKNPNSNELVLKSDAFDKSGKRFTLQSWASALAEDAPHLLEPSKGGGAGGGGSSTSMKDGKTILRNPTPIEFAKHAAKIASGEIIVERDGR